MVSFWHINQVLEFLLDSDTAARDNIIIIQATSMLLKIDCCILNSPLKALISSLCADAGRCSSRDSLAIEIAKLG